MDHTGTRRRLNPWLGGALAACVIALFCSLGCWQLGRARQKQAMLAQVETVLARRQAVPLAVAGDAARARGYDWAAGRGRFTDAPALLLDNQLRQGRPGVRAYRLFVDDAGAPLLVELGWIALPPDRSLPAIALPDGELAVSGLLLPPPSAGLGGGVLQVQGDGSLLAVGLDLPAVARQWGLATLPPRVLRLDPALQLGHERDLDVLPNTLPPEKHLGYAVQWFGLASAVLVISVVLCIRQRRRGHEKIRA